MTIELFKDHPLLPCVFLALSIDPAPYVVIDKGDRIQLTFPAELDPMRSYRLGVLTADMEKAVRGTQRAWKAKYRKWLTK